MIYLYAMVLTAGVETLVMRCLRYRGFWLLTWFFVLNLASNFALNWAYAKYWYLAPKIVMIGGLELAAFVLESLLFGIFAGYGKKMFGSVFLANLISFGLGVLLFGI